MADRVVVLNRSAALSFDPHLHGDWDRDRIAVMPVSGVGARRSEAEIAHDVVVCSFHTPERPGTRSPREVPVGA